MLNSSPENIEIRIARPGDARLLSVLAAVTFYEAYFEQDDPHNLADYIVESFGLETIAKELEDQRSTFMIAYGGGRAVGYAKLTAGSREPCIGAEKTIELERIYLVERVWRKGVGELLLNCCVEEARRLEMETIWLGVWQMNARERPFYEKHGFVKVGTLEFPYGDSVGINDVMELIL